MTPEMSRLFYYSPTPRHRLDLCESMTELVGNPLNPGTLNPRYHLHPRLQRVAATESQFAPSQSVPPRRHGDPFIRPHTN